MTVFCSPQAKEKNWDSRIYTDMDVRFTERWINAGAKAKVVPGEEKNATKDGGYGFITIETGRSIFFHLKNIIGDGKYLKEGCQVCYKKKIGSYEANNVRFLCL